MKIYFTDEEDELRRWYKQTYGDRCSAVFKDYIKILRERETTGPTQIKDCPAEIILRCFDDVDKEKEWIADMRTCGLNPADVIRRRMTDLQKKYPAVAGDIRGEMEKKYPILVRIGGL